MFSDIAHTGAVLTKLSQNTQVILLKQLPTIYSINGLAEICFVNLEEVHPSF